MSPPLVRSRGCPRCRQLNPLAAAYCGACGAPLVTGVIDQPGEQASRDATELLAWHPSRAAVPIVLRREPAAALDAAAAAVRAAGGQIRAVVRPRGLSFSLSSTSVWRSFGFAIRWDGRALIQRDGMRDSLVELDCRVAWISQLPLLVIGAAALGLMARARMSALPVLAVIAAWVAWRVWAHAVASPKVWLARVLAELPGAAIARPRAEPLKVGDAKSIGGGGPRAAQGDRRGAESLEALDDLRKKGVLSDADYERMRTRLNADR